MGRFVKLPSVQSFLSVAPWTSDRRPSVRRRASRAHAHTSGLAPQVPARPLPEQVWICLSDGRDCKGIRC